MKGKSGLFLVFVSFCTIAGMMSSCFLQDKTVQKYVIQLLSAPFSNVVMKLNGANYLTNSQVSLDEKTIVTLETDALQYFDRNQYIAGNDTLLTFNRWSTGATNTSISFIVTKADSYTAIFTVDFKVSGMTTPSSNREEIPITAYYASGTALEVEAPNVSGKSFSHWIVNGVDAGNENPLTITITEPKMIQAVYTDNQASPTAFFIVSPTDGATQIDNLPYVQLLWTASADPQGGPIVYDVYLGENQASLEKIAENIGETYLLSTTLAASKTYYWYVKSKSALGLETRTATHTFSTVVYPPSIPFPVFPQDGHNAAPYLTTLIWECTGASEYDLYYGITEEASQLIPGLTSKQFRLPQLTVGTAYVWRIIAKNVFGSTEGPWWHFTVSNDSIPPSMPDTPSPEDSAIEQELEITLTWEDPVTGTRPLLYDVYFGTAAGQFLSYREMTWIETDIEATQVHITDLKPNTNYLWQIVAKNPWGVASSTIWSFTTKDGEHNPTIPENPYPANGATDVILNPVLSWDPSENGTITYDVYFGTVPIPVTKIANNLTTPVCTLSELFAATTYYWRVVAKNESGEQESSIWSYTTKTNDLRISLQKITGGFLILSNEYFSPSSYVIIQMRSNTIDSTHLSVTPSPSIKMTPEGDYNTFFIFDNGETAFSHFTLTDLTLATVTCSGQGLINLQEFFNDTVQIPVVTTPISFP